MGKQIFVDFELAPDFGFLKEASSWVGFFKEAIGTALWFAIANKAGGDAWAWGLAHVVVCLAFSNDSHFHGCCNFVNAMSGGNWVKFFFTFFSQILGCIALGAVGGHIGLEGRAFETSLSFSTIASKNFYEYFFGTEFFGLFLYVIFSKRSSKDSGVPSSLWNILLIAVAFWVGGDGFGFVPARNFNTFKSFCDAGAWATTVCQFWAVTVASVILDFAWKE